MSNKYNKTHQAVTGNGSALEKYQQVIVGSHSLWATLYFEICSWFGVIPGAFGLLLRKVFWPKLFGACGHGVQFATGITLRHPNRIILGNNVVISENVVLDARNEASSSALIIGNNTMLSNQVAINCKGGSVCIGDDVGIGIQSIIQSTNDCPVSINNDVIIGPRAYIVGGGSYNLDDIEAPIRLQGIKQDSGVIIDCNVWLGANVTVLGDSHIEHGSVVAAGSLVNSHIKSNSIVAGTPAKVLKQR